MSLRALRPSYSLTSPPQHPHCVALAACASLELEALTSAFSKARARDITLSWLRTRDLAREVAS